MMSLKEFFKTIRWLWITKEYWVENEEVDIFVLLGVC